MVMQIKPVAGVIPPGEQYYGIESWLNGEFWHFYPDQKPPSIEWAPDNEVYQSGTIRFEISIGGKPSQVILVAIAPKTGEGLWAITAGGVGEAVRLAEQTARNFVFK
jgi:hypothetical protein